MIFTLPPAASAALLPLLTKFGILLSTGVYLSRGYISSFQSAYNYQLTPVISIEDGALQGKLAYSRGGREYWQFLGIKYGEAPVDNLRFQPPVPAKPWGSKVKQVTKFAPACIQFDPLFVVRSIGVEDCLFLNVFTNAASATAVRQEVEHGVPVLVYFHGGAFLEGEATFYHPTFLMDHGPIVVVTCQYRLGPLGFLNFQEKSDPKYPRGNMGLKDQNLVLRWVQKNIARFGGDSQRITVMGESAGGASVSYHVTSPLSRGLFHRAISISGSSLSPWAYTERARDIAEKYGRRLGCQGTSTEQLFSCYQNMNANDLVKLQWSWANPLMEKDEFVPSVEPMIITNDTFLAERPIKIMQNGRASPVPFILGVTSGEGSLRSARFEAMPELLQKLGNDWDNLIGRVMFFDEDPVSPEIARKLREYYFEGIPRNVVGAMLSNRESILKILTRLSGDALFNEPVHTSAVEHAKMGSPTYLFYYDYRSKLYPGAYSFYRSVTLKDRIFSPLRLLSGLASDWVSEKLFGGERKQRTVYDVGHAEDTVQVWDAFGISGQVGNGDKEFSEEFVKTLVNFVMGGEPNFRGIKWSRVNGKNLNQIPYMLIDKGGQGNMILEPFSERMKFWEGLARLRKERR